MGGLCRQGLVWPRGSQVQGAADRGRRGVGRKGRSKESPCYTPLLLGFFVVKQDKAVFRVAQVTGAGQAWCYSLEFPGENRTGQFLFVGALHGCRDSGAIVWGAMASQHFLVLVLVGSTVSRPK